MNCFPKDKQKAGRTWVQGFLKRFPQLMCRKATNLSVVRVMAANEPNICKWFVEYKKVLHDLNITSPVQFGPVMRQAYRTFQRRKRSSVRNVNQPIKPLLLTKGKPLPGADLGGPWGPRPPLTSKFEAPG